MKKNLIAIAVLFGLMFAGCHEDAVTLEPQEIAALLPPPLADSAFKYKITKAQLNGKFGWINMLGEWMIPAQYDELGEHWNGRITTARIGDKYGVIDHNNQIILPFEYDSKPVIVKNIAKFGYNETCSPDHIKVLEPDTGVWRVLDFTGRQLNQAVNCGMEHNTLDVRRADRYSPTLDFDLRNFNGTPLLHFFDAKFCMWFEPFHGNRAKFFIGKYTPGGTMLASPLHYGFIDTFGNIAIPPKFMLEKEYDSRFGNVDACHDGCNEFHFIDSKALVRHNGSFHLIDTSGYIVHTFDPGTYRVHSPNPAGFRTYSGLLSGKNVLAPDGTVVYSDSDSDWDIGTNHQVGYNFDDSGLIHMVSTTLLGGQTFEIRNSKFELVFAFDESDATFRYRSDYSSAKRFIKVDRTASSETIDGFSQDAWHSDAGGVSSKFVSFEGQELTPWLDATYTYMPDLGLVFESSGSAFAKELQIRNFEGEVIYSAKNARVEGFRLSKSQFYSGGYRALTIEHADGSKEFISHKGVNFSAKKLTNFSAIFTDYSDAFFSRGKFKPSEHGDFTLNFTEADVVAMFQRLYPDLQ